MEGIYLPEGAVIVQRHTETENKTGLILTLEKSKPNTGTVIATCKSLQKFQGAEVVFREAFIEEIDIEGIKNAVYLRDFNSSIWYAK